MAETEVELISRLYALGDAGDFERFVRALHPDVEWQTAPESPDPGVYRGREGVRRVLENFHAFFADVRHELDEIQVKDEHVVVTCRVHGRARASGVEVTEQRAHVWTMEAGRPRLIRAYLDVERAVAEATTRTGFPAPRRGGSA